MQSLTYRAAVAVALWNKSPETRVFAERCLQSLIDHLSEPCQLILVDNDSPYPINPFGIFPAFRAKGHAPVLVQNATNEGFGKAINTAASMCLTEYFFQMNSDCELVEDSVRILIDFMELHGVHVAMPEHYESCQHYNMPKTGEIMGRDWKFGAFWGMKRDLFRAIGGFDERFDMCYFEDTDLWRRLEDDGYSVRGYRNTWVKHKGGASSLPNRDEIFERNKKLFEEKWSTVHGT